ncbi:hypothetical protein BBG20_22740 [Pseudomonas aylmerensis]|uniref:Secreted protein n=1 Tax=Pseudomonas aylmerensis TaxID=1869229 RepID=A0ABX2YQ84_9PSED|nr:hypothetical protein BBG20_22740 [Pseudomonas aylmerensis]
MNGLDVAARLVVEVGLVVEVELVVMTELIVMTSLACCGCLACCGKPAHHKGWGMAHLISARSRGTDGA